MLFLTFSCVRTDYEEHLLRHLYYGAMTFSIMTLSIKDLIATLSMSIEFPLCWGLHFLIVMLNGVLLSVIMLSVFIKSVFMLNVWAPKQTKEKESQTLNQAKKGLNKWSHSNLLFV